MNNLVAVIAIVIFIALGAWYFWYGPEPYRSRKCMGREWRKSFPNAPKDAIREFLSCLADGMAFSQKTRLKFRPDDRVIDIYRSIYGGRTPYGDAMECETFLENLSESFSIELEILLSWSHEEVTLGEMFGRITAQQVGRVDT